MTQTMDQAQQKALGLLRQAGIAYLDLDAFGGDIHVTASTQADAMRWSAFCEKFCTSVREPMPHQEDDDFGGQRQVWLVLATF